MFQDDEAQAQLHKEIPTMETQTVSTQTARREKPTPPPNDFRTARPWRFMLRTLGTFRLDSSAREVDTASGAGPKWNLLKLLVAARCEPVLVTRLASELWPSRAPAASRSAFDTTLHRLRYQLGDKALVVLDGGAVRLDQRSIWVDAWAFTSLQETVTHSAPAASLEELERLSRRVVALYRGTFAEAEPQPSLVRASARLTRSFVLTIERLVDGFRKHAALEQAVNLIETALDREETSESLHQRAIALWLERGLPGEAENAYERCRTALHARRKTTPSLAIDRLVQTARHARNGSPDSL